MDYKFKFLKYKIKSEKLEKKIYEYIEKNNIDIKNVYNLMNTKKNIIDNEVSYDVKKEEFKDLDDTELLNSKIINVEEENNNNNDIMISIFNDFK